MITSCNHFVGCVRFSEKIANFSKKASKNYLEKRRFEILNVH